MILCIDLETTGLDEQRCGLVEIGAVWLHTGESFCRQCQPDERCLIEEEALKVNGSSRSQILYTGRLLERIAIIEFLGWVRGSLAGNSKVQFAGWNAHFDFRHLNASLTRAGVPDKDRPFSHRLVDLHSVLAMDLMRKSIAGPLATPYEMQGFGAEVANCDVASDFLRLPTEPKPHNALAGAKQARAMFRRLLGDTGALP